MDFDTVEVENHNYLSILLMKLLADLSSVAWVLKIIAVMLKVNFLVRSSVFACMISFFRALVRKPGNLFRHTSHWIGQGLGFMLVLMLPIALRGQSNCSPNDITLLSQADVDALAMSGCTSVVGDLSIQGANINNLTGLANLTSIGGSLVISNNSILTNLDGLSNITSVGASINIGVNGVLTNLNGLSGITSVPEYLVIQTNPSLTSLAGLSNVTSVGIKIDIDNNDALTNLDGLSNITSIGSDLDITDNNALTNLDGLSGLSSIGNNVLFSIMEL